jgi:hypothetical protein
MIEDYGLLIEGGKTFVERRCDEEASRQRRNLLQEVNVIPERDGAD